MVPIKVAITGGKNQMCINAKDYTVSMIIYVYRLVWYHLIIFDIYWYLIYICGNYMEVSYNSCSHFKIFVSHPGWWDPWKPSIYRSNAPERWVSPGDREAELNPEVKNPGWHRKLRRIFFSDLRRMTKRKGESNWKSGSGLRHFLRIQQPNKTTTVGSRLWATSKSIRR